MTGALPPLGAAAWEREFAKYRASPEFQQLNARMTLAEYKFIYGMEWAHRQWGRAVGLGYLLPLAYFAARGRIARRDLYRILPIGGLIGAQGALGWWMVRSGLGEEHRAPGSHPRVSHYRLAAHLGTALLTYAAMLTAGLGVLRAHRVQGGRLGAAHRNLTPARLRRRFGRLTAALCVLVFCTALSGGLVAGLDAGLVYNHFPYMGGGETWLPPARELVSDFYAGRTDGADRLWRNMLENPAMVQLEHRIMAVTTFTSVLALHVYAVAQPQLRRFLPRPIKRALSATLLVACGQVALGISTLIYLVPTPLASLHQAGALTLLTAALILRFRAVLPHALAKHVKRIKRKNRLGTAKQASS